jgi:hypothetical protein
MGRGGKSAVSSAGTSLAPDAVLFFSSGCWELAPVISAFMMISFPNALSL